jgi:hypothetical protein
MIIQQLKIGVASCNSITIKEANEPNYPYARNVPSRGIDLKIRRHLLHTNIITVWTASISISSRRYLYHYEAISLTPTTSLTLILLPLWSQSCQFLVPFRYPDGYSLQWFRD